MSKDISMASLTPIKVYTTTDHGFTTGNNVVIMGVVGNDNANGSFTITVTGSDNFTLDDTESSGIGSGGTVTVVTALTVAGATNATPIVITTSGAHGLESGNRVIISGVLGNTRANGTFTITKVDSTNFSLDGSYGNGTYTSGGTITQTQSDPSGDPTINPISDISTAEGENSLLLSGNLSPMYGFNNAINEVFYNIVAVDLSGVPTGDWEIGLGAYDSATFQLERCAVIASSETDNGGNTGGAGVRVDFASGPKFVTMTPMEGLS